MKLKQSKQFKKDLKRYIHQPKKLKELQDVTNHLEEYGFVPSQYKPHKLQGEYKGCLECHIEDNFLLIWIDDTSNLIKLIRLGTHHELFGI